MLNLPFSELTPNSGLTNRNTSARSLTETWITSKTKWYLKCWSWMGTSTTASTTRTLQFSSWKRAWGRRSPRQCTSPQWRTATTWRTWAVSERTRPPEPWWCTRPSFPANWKVQTLRKSSPMRNPWKSSGKWRKWLRLGGKRKPSTTCGRKSRWKFIGTGRTKTSTRTNSESTKTTDSPSSPSSSFSRKAHKYSCTSRLSSRS